MKSLSPGPVGGWAVYTAPNPGLEWIPILP